MLPELAIGVLNSPNSAVQRSLIRSTWMLDPMIRCGRITVRFVIGNGSCFSATVAREMTLHEDMYQVNAPDCQKSYGPEKTHEWFKAALRTFPSAEWIAKTEDDTMLWPSAIMADLRSLTPSAEYYGSISWQG